MFFHLFLFNKNQIKYIFYKLSFKRGCKENFFDNILLIKAKLISNYTEPFSRIENDPYIFFWAIFFLILFSIKKILFFDNIAESITKSESKERMKK